jgi:hypothetical protein
VDRQALWVSETRHTIRRGVGTDELMPAAQVVLMEVEPDGTAQVYRYALDGEFAGDTWHESRTDAEDQLEFEYGQAVGPWSEVPPDTIDAHDYALKWSRRSRPEA